MKRRSFLFGCLGAGTIARTDPLKNTIETPAEPTKIKEYRTLGRTGFKASDIGCGPSMTDPSVLRTMITRGVNYLDTGESYSDGRDEILIGKAIKGLDRKSVFITTKLVLKGKETSQEIKNRALKCQERLDTEYVDCLMIHMAQSRSDVKNEAFHEATRELKKEGNLRFVGVSCHGSSWIHNPEETMEEVLGAAIEDGRFDVFLLVYNYLKRDMGERVLRDCREKKIGTTLMKTDPFGGGAFDLFNDMYTEQEKQGRETPDWIKELRTKYEEKRKLAQPFINKHNLTNPIEIRNAAIRFVLDNPDVHSVVLTCRNFDDVERFLTLSGSRFTLTDASNLAARADIEGRLYCRHACGLCEPHCPSRVPVNTIMRYNHYFVAQGREKYAMEKYEKIHGQRADVCKTCKGFCQAACPFNVPVNDLLKFAHSNLSLA